jgi:branched-chain amino acid transport system permease protein
VFGVLMGIPTLRLRADYFAIVTIAIGEIVDYLANNWTSLTGGATGTLNLLGPQNAATYDGTWQSLEQRVQGWFAHVIGSASTATVVSMAVVWVLVVIVALVVGFLVRSPWGRVLAAIRDDEDAAAAIGKDVFRYKLQVLAVGGVLAGLAGLLYAFQAATISPADFDPTITFYAWTILILGGATRVLAVPVGAVVFGILYAGVLFFTFPPFSLLSSTQRSYLQLMIVGAVLILLMRVRPQGLLGRRDEMLVG